MNLLLLSNQWEKIEKLYQNQENITHKVCIKLLIRIKKMYEAKDTLMKILRMIK